MSDLTTLPHQLDAKKGTCRAIIETPKGNRNKFDYDPESNLFMLGGLLPEGMTFLFDFGFIPSTIGDDGDPLDILVLMDSPAHVGCLIEERLIGVISAEQLEDGKKETTTGCWALRYILTIMKTCQRSMTSARHCSRSLNNSSFLTTNSVVRSSG